MNRFASSYLQGIVQWFLGLVELRNVGMRDRGAHFQCADWLDDQPGVALRSTPGYRRSSRWDDPGAIRTEVLHQTERLSLVACEDPGLRCASPRAIDVRPAGTIREQFEQESRAKLRLPLVTCEDKGFRCASPRDTDVRPVGTIQWIAR